jgi:hypothetical protein
MVLLTGDVHHMSLKTKDQTFLPPGTTELVLCEKYLSIANSQGIKPLLFITSRMLIDEEVLLKQLLSRFHFDIGGHYVACSGPLRRLFFGCSRRIFNLANGPAFVQRRGIEHARQVFREKLGYKIKAWRNHAHRTDKNTNKLLAALGFSFVSNRVGNSCARPLLFDRGLWDVPINTLPDHQWLPHSLNKQPKLSVNEWVKKVLEQIENQQQLGIVSTIIAHPCCMYIEDDFRAFEDLCRGIARYKAVTFEELLHLLS